MCVNQANCDTCFATYMYQTIMMYLLNLYNVLYQLDLINLG